MTASRCTVLSTVSVAPTIFVLAFRSPFLASTSLPGQFVNILVADTGGPLLRRPFSVYRTEGDRVEIIFSVVGAGTRILSGKRPGDAIDVLGPLGRPFATSGCETAILVGGGLGVAPLPMLAAAVEKENVRAVTYLGARSASQLVGTHLPELRTATDDGTSGFHGTVVALLRRELCDGALTKPKIFGCGPNPMLRALAACAQEAGIPCEVSLESVMACGVGLCQGCPVERTGGSYSLICCDGPVFDAGTIRLP